MVDKTAANAAKNAGNVNFKKGDYEAALASYDDAIRLNPEEVRNQKQFQHLHHSSFFLLGRSSVIFLIPLANHVPGKITSQPKNLVPEHNSLPAFENIIRTSNTASWLDPNSLSVAAKGCSPPQDLGRSRR